MMNPWPIEIGSVVISKAGRDQGRAFLVVAEVEKQISSLPSMALKTTVLFPAPEGPEITRSFPFLFILLNRLFLLAIHLPEGAVGDHHKIVVHFRHHQKQPAPVAAGL